MRTCALRIYLRLRRGESSLSHIHRLRDVLWTSGGKIWSVHPHAAGGPGLITLVSIGWIPSYKAKKKMAFFLLISPNVSP